MASGSNASLPWLRHAPSIAAALHKPDGPATEFDIPPEEAAAGGRMWYWQLCTEYGYWQRASDDRAVSVYSRYVTLAYFQGLCQQMFNLTQAADTAATNHCYYEHLATATHIFYTNDENDPWSELSIRNDSAEAVARDIHTYVIAGASHVRDLYQSSANDSPSLKGARQKFDELVTSWLPQ